VVVMAGGTVRYAGGLDELAGARSLEDAFLDLTTEEVAGVH
jgi:hypothetical protein